MHHKNRSHQTKKNIVLKVIQLDEDPRTCTFGRLYILFEIGTYLNFETIERFARFAFKVGLAWTGVDVTRVRQLTGHYIQSVITMENKRAFGKNAYMQQVNTFARLVLLSCRNERACSFVAALVRMSQATHLSDTTKQRIFQARICQVYPRREERLHA